MSKAIKGLSGFASDDQRWQAQDDLRTLQRAHEVMSNKKRMSMVQKEAQKQTQLLNKVTSKTKATPKPITKKPIKKTK